MARARNIKPGFFANEDLAECEPLARLLFAGLWCLADREGRLEDRPKRIRAELLPYDSCDADDLLNQLQARGFILRYSHGAGRFIQVLKFDSHQNPHMKEAKSSIPAPGSEVPVSALDGAGSDGALEQHEASTRQAPDKNEKSPAESGFLIPDSGFSDPLSPQPPKGGGARRGRKAEDEPAGFARFWSEWPASDRKGAKGRCQEAWSRHGCEAIADEIIAHIVHKRDTTTWAKNRGEFVEAPLVYLNQRRWEGAEPAVAGGNGPAAMGFDIGSDAYLQANSKAAWWREAGFANVWEAASARCWHTNAHKFRDGKLIPATQEETA